MSRFPETGRPREEVLSDLLGQRARDLQSDGRAFAFVYDAGEEVRGLLRDAYAGCMGINGLDPTVYPSARTLENAVVAAYLELLRAPPAAGTTDLAAAVGAFVHRTRRRGIAVLVSDFYDPAGFTGALDLLRYHRFESFALQIIDPGEARPELHGDLELVDCETGAARPITVSPRLLADYLRAHEALCHDLAAYCKARGITSLRVETDTPFDKLVLRLFRQGGFLQ